MVIEKFIIDENSSIENAIELISFNNSRCAIVICENRKAIGAISEGDILRALLKGVNIKAKVKNIMSTNYRYLFEKDKEKIIKLYKEGITLIPILDINHCVTELVIFPEFL
jgi:predicted transcriptional regulator